MSTTVGQEDWEALMDVLQQAIQALSGKQAEPVKLKILEFSSTAAMLELQDLADCAGRFEAFLLSTVAPDWDDEATATLSFSMGALVEKMQMSSYSPAFSAGLSEVLMYLDFYGEDEEAAQPEPEPPEPSVAPVAPVVEPMAEASPPMPETPEEKVAVATSAPPTDASSPAVDEDALLAEILAGVESAEEPQAEAQPEASPVTPVTSAPAVAAEPLPVPRPRPASVDFDTDADGYVIDRMEWYQEVLREDPQSRLFIALAEELCDSGLWDQVIEVCRGGLAYHPDSLRARVLLGQALWETGKPAEAHAALIQVHSAIADNAVLYHLLARIAEADGESRLVEEFHRTGLFLEEESRRLAFDRVTRAPIPVPSPVPSVAAPQAPVEEPVRAPAPPAPEKRPAKAGTLGWLLRLQDLFAEKEPVSPVISPLFSDEDRAVLKAILSASVS